MPTLSRFKKFAILIGSGTVSSAALLYYTVYGSNEEIDLRRKIHPDNCPPYPKWDHNWDRRDPTSLVKPLKTQTEADQKNYNAKLEAHKAKAIRHLILIRHGQYNLTGETDSERSLTDLGKRQAEYTGKRLRQLAFPFSTIITSTMTRAHQTAEIIERYFKDVHLEDDSMLVEGAPIKPEPSIGHWKSDKIFFRDGARIEAAFRKYFHRASPHQEKESYTLLVCHANVIRYFVCRALQFPPEAWLRFSLKNGSITWISIHPSGRVSLKCFGDSGYMPAEAITTS